MQLAHLASTQKLFSCQHSLMLLNLYSPLFTLVLEVSTWDGHYYLLLMSLGLHKDLHNDLHKYLHNDFHNDLHNKVFDCVKNFVIIQRPNVSWSPRLLRRWMVGKLDVTEGYICSEDRSLAPEPRKASVPRVTVCRQSNTSSFPVFNGWLPVNMEAGDSDSPSWTCGATVSPFR